MGSKVVVWLHGEVRTPPFSREARIETGCLLRRLQDGESLTMPHSKPVREIGTSCHELRVTDQSQAWRIVYAITADAVVVLDVFCKKTVKMPRSVIEGCRARLKRYGQTTGDPV